jgi:hypothetical protein
MGAHESEAGAVILPAAVALTIWTARAHALPVARMVRGISAVLYRALNWMNGAAELTRSKLIQVARAANLFRLQDWPAD